MEPSNQRGDTDVTTTDMTLRDLLIPCAPLGTELILEWPDRSIFRIKRVGRVYVDVCPLMVNIRVVTTPVDADYSYERFWCYVGRGHQSFMAAVLAATMWDGQDGTEPLGWNKNGQTQEFRDAGHPQVWQSSRASVVMAEAMLGVDLSASVPTGPVAAASGELRPTRDRG